MSHLPEWQPWKESVSGDEVEAVSQSYDLRVRSWTTLRSGQSVVRRLECADGIFVLHVHGPIVTREYLQQMQRARIVLAANGLPTVEPILNRDGHPLLE